MAQQLDTLAELQNYARRVVDRAAHHAAAVEDILDRLLAQVILHHDPGTVECRTYGPQPSNVLRFSVRGHRVALAYNHQGQVEIRDGGERGRVLAAFSNSDTRQRVAGEFERL